MAKRREGFHFTRSLLWVPILTLGAAIGILALDRETGLFPLVDLLDQVRTTEQRVSELEDRRRHLIDHVRGLRANPFTIESVARTKLGMVRPGEVVLRWQSPPDVD